MDKSTHSPLWERVKVRLVTLREEAGLTQRQLAAKVKAPQTIIARLEMGERRLDVVELFTIVRALGGDATAEFASLAAEFAAVADARAEKRRRKAKKPGP